MEREGEGDREMEKVKTQSGGKRSGGMQYREEEGDSETLT